MRAMGVQPPHISAKGREVKTFLVRDLMVPLSEYASVSEEATLYEAFLALERAQKEFDHTKYRHLGILILDKHKRVVGKLSNMDALRALESTYASTQDFGDIRKMGFSDAFMRRLHAEARARGAPLTQICRKAADLQAKDFMQNAAEDEYIDAEASLNEAIPRLVFGRTISLLVKRGETFVGVLRQSDVFAAVFHLMRACELNGESQ